MRRATLRHTNLTHEEKSLYIPPLSHSLWQLKFILSLEMFSSAVFQQFSYVS